MDVISVAAQHSCVQSLVRFVNVLRLNYWCVGVRVVRVIYHNPTGRLSIQGGNIGQVFKPYTKGT